jgi:hypothetical protein
MKQIRLLSIVFDTEIRTSEIPAFRGAIIQKAGQENILFHNHLGNDSFVYRYPLIQYKKIGRHPAMVCIDQGVDEIHKYFQNPDWSISISGRTVPMKILSLNMNRFTMQVWDKSWRYTIRNWVALNQENYLKYRATESLAQRTQLLASILLGNILSFAKGIEWDVDKPVQLSITDMNRTNLVRLKGNDVTAFNLTFKCNVFLPNHIGLGKSITQGYGVVREVKNNRNEPKEQ